MGAEGIGISWDVEDLNALGFPGMCGILVDWDVQDLSGLGFPGMCRIFLDWDLPGCAGFSWIGISQDFGMLGREAELLLGLLLASLELAAVCDALLVPAAAFGASPEPWGWEGSGYGIYHSHSLLRSLFLSLCPKPHPRFSSAPLAPKVWL